MTGPSSSDTSSAPDKVAFVRNHLPILDSGTYELTVTQRVTISDIPRPEYRSKRTFAVRGPRYALDPADLDSVFPPEGSQGDHYNVLPHVAFKRSTLPWERKPVVGTQNSAADDLPWLALLLLDETESAGSSVVTLGELRTPSTGTAPDWPGLLQEPGEDDKALVTVLDVERSLLQSLLPDVASLPYMAHVRHGTRDGKAVGEELAIVLGNRLPKRNAHSTVHLVALEGRYTSEGFKWHSEQSRSGRLISLKSWSFTCVDPQQRFSEILKNLDPYFGTLSPRHPATLQLPPRNNPTADSYLAMGYVPLGHTARAGSRTVSWYHGPLVPWESAESITLPVRTADELVRYDPAIGMFDVSYAAAWQLGRLLTLQSKQVSTSLYAWKRNMAQALRSAEQHVQHLPFSPEHAAGDLERTVDAWFDNLHKLKGVPFNYLVPDERLLPPESIRFFWLDPIWIDCLLDGAFSIGRVTSSDHRHDETFQDTPAQRRNKKVTGFLLRSDVVRDWPGLLVDGYDASSQLLELLRMDRLSPGVLVCLFKGEARSVELHLKPETLHFGLDEPSGQQPTLHKILRNPNPPYQETEDTTIEHIPWLSEEARTIRFGTTTKDGTSHAGLAAQIQAKTGASTFTSAQFALQMVEGVEKVIYRNDTPATSGR